MKTLRKITAGISSFLLVLFILFAVALVGVRLVGIEPHIVLSGSMEPEIYTGSLVYVKQLSRQEAMNLQAGDTVTYLVDQRGTKVTHKIYEVVGPLYVKDQYGRQVLDDAGQPVVAVDDGGYPIIMYTTYGVNNKNPSSASGYTLDGKPGEGNLASSNVVGRPVFSVPLLGYVAAFVQNPPGKYVTIAICVFLVVGALWNDEPKKKKPDEPQQIEETQDSLPAEPPMVEQGQETDPE